MERFIYDYLDDEYEVVGGLDGGSQRVFCLVRRCSRTYSMTASIPLAADQYFASSWKVDVTGDCVMTRYSYLRRPLLTEIVIRSAEGTPRRLIVIGLHLKSKHLAGGRVLWETDDIDDRMTYIKKAVETRRRIAAEIQRCRNLIDLMMDENPDLDVIVAGDVNDGPGADLFEQRYLLSNASDALLGSPFRPDTLFCHTVLRCHRGVGVPRGGEEGGEKKKKKKMLRFRSGGVDVGRSSSLKRGGGGGGGGGGGEGVEEGETKAAADDDDNDDDVTAPVTSSETETNRVWTIEFDDYVDGSVRKVLIDHVLCSPSLKITLEKSDVAHEAFKENCLGRRDSYEDRTRGGERHHRPADHRPIWADFVL